MFNQYVWETYLSGNGKETVALFENNILNNYTMEYVNEICRYHHAYCPSKVINKALRIELNGVFDFISDGYYMLVDGEYTIKSALKEVYNSFLEECKTPQNIFSVFSDSVAFYSTLLSIELPELFIPYYYKYNYNVLEIIAREFDIALPEIPIKQDYEGRFFYYGEICETLYDFRIQNNMSPCELCAFLYDFAPKYIGGFESYIIKELPEAKSAYFIGGAKNDAFLSDDNDIITPWQCNPETMAGDMIVMYLKTPISSVDSVWRSVSIGFNDPFFYYYRCTYIGNPQKINRVSQKQLQDDELLKNLPIVRKNMQGINGVELYPSYYNHLLDMAKSNIPRFEFVVEKDNSKFLIEKDVENKLIKQFISKLGYSEKEYTQQMYIEIGNHNHALIPDFVVNPVVSKGHCSADFLIEAKLSIPNKKFLEETKTQARSYANILKTKYSVVASKEGIWISSSSDDFSQDIVSFSWGQLEKEDNFYKVMCILGNGKLK